MVPTESNDIELKRKKDVMSRRSMGPVQPKLAIPPRTHGKAPDGNAPDGKAPDVSPGPPASSSGTGHTSQATHVDALPTSRSSDSRTDLGHALAPTTLVELVASWGNGYQFQIEDHGGGGDCMFKSISAGLMHLRAHWPAKGNQIMQQLACPNLSHRAVRNAMARQYTSGADENFCTTFLNRILAWVNFENLERSGTQGAWKDRFWSPISCIEAELPF